jgi:hypothetical protein
MTKRDLCSCGFPQSHPIPHPHDRDSLEVVVEELERAEKHLILGLTFDAHGAVMRALRAAKELQKQ